MHMSREISFADTKPFGVVFFFNFIYFFISMALLVVIICDYLVEGTNYNFCRRFTYLWKLIKTIETTIVH